jgi:hypothetical protein
MLLLLPDLGRLVGPAVCGGTLEPVFQRARLEYRCVADGEARPIKTDMVIAYMLPLLTASLLLPTGLLVGRASRRANERQWRAERDLANAVEAQAEVLRISRGGNFKRQLLMRVAELRLVLWVQPPNGRPYEATVAWIVEEHGVRHLSVGAQVAVRVNPLRPERVYPAEPWAHYGWW